MASSLKRSLYFDNAKFILIFLVVFGHVISPLKENNDVLFSLYSFIFLFHMPAFIFISGYFSKGYNKKGYFMKVAKKILLPYLIFQALYSLFYYADGEISSLRIDFLKPHWTLWYLLSMCCWNLFLYVFAKLKWKGFILAVAIGIGIGYFDHAGSYLSLSRTLVFFPYFLLGFLIEQKHLRAVLNKRFSPVVGVSILVLTLLILASFFPKDAIPWLLGDTSYAGMGVKDLSGGFIRSIQYVLTGFVAYGFLSIVPTRGNLFTFVGGRTLYIYLMHGFIIKSIQQIISDETLRDFSDHYMLLILFSLAICLFLGSYMIKKYTRPIIELDYRL